jgi:hypothetical protein
MLGVKVALLAASAAAIVGTVAAGAANDWDLAVLFAVLGAIDAGLLYTLSGPRRLFMVRADLARWIEQRAATSGEPVGHVLDRCVAAYRAGMTVSDE